MYSFTSKSLTASLLLAVAAQAQQPYNDWEKSYQAATDLVSSWTIAQRANITVRGGEAPGYTPFTPADGPQGVTNARGASGWVNPQALAASWDLDLVSREYSAMAAEFRDKGYSMLLGPISGPLGRSPFSGRLYESFGSDPYLSGKMFAESIKVIQEQSVLACGKHFIANEQETDRTADAAEDRTNSIVDDRTMHEVYLWPWIDGVASGMGSAMCVMNRVNGVIGCESEDLMTKLLREELGFKGFMVPDVTAPVDYTAGVLAGLDWNSGHTLESLLPLIENGTVPEELITQHAIRIVAAMLNYNEPQESYPGLEEARRTVVRQPDSKAFIRKAAAESIVLLKNEANTLPLKPDGQLFGIFGVNAATLDAGPVPVLNPLNNAGETWPSHLASGGGGSSAPNPYVVSPLHALTQRASETSKFDLIYILEDNYTLYPPPMDNPGLPLDWADPSIVGYAERSDVCLVFLNAFAKEGADRKTLRDEAGDELVQNVASYCDNTVVVVNSAGVRLVDAWIEHPNVTAVLASAPLGQESGNSIVDVLFGDVNPSGKLPYTIAKTEADYNGEICECCECEYTEGLFIDYRHFDQKGIEPRFEFGFGMSYTEFEFSGLQVESLSGCGAMTPLRSVSAGEPVEGGRSDVFNELFTVTAEVQNTGDVAGAVVAQLYLGFPDVAKAPVRQLRGFKKVFLEPGESVDVEFTLQRRDLSVWDIDSQQWAILNGTYKVMLGRSSRDIVGEVMIALHTA